MSGQILGGRHAACRSARSPLLVVATLAAAFVSSSAWSAITPGPCASDEHVRCAEYDATTAYRIPYRIGEAFVVQFEADEIVDDKSGGLGSGESEGWSVGGKANWFMFKPSKKKPNTNVLIVTNKRRYVFQFDAAARNEAAIWSLSFDYPDTRAKAEQAAKAKADKALAIEQAGADTSERRNDDYDMKGDVAIAPTAVWDDGRFTYFQYDTSRRVPEIYEIQADGTEAAPKRHVDGDTIVIEGMATGFVLRLGKTVMAVRNNAYSPDGSFNRTGTTVPGWVRITKDGNHG
ncbi:TPA: TrbG/VirB9 family P-type conjugative transfer protein [Burkholderia cepacia ATCC 25416]|uniref:Plasmid conjugation protein TrbG n=2 Tax=Burkholderiaceae TaxID=119060 RepID=A0AAJ5NGD4_9BURK|nr:MULTISPECIES: TrbG/VirB9 family P-type conjugative transfer protein [Burkholderia]ELK7725294.1 TrbG/VirB9 family P-type conjugative transfer protein [Burkholderia cenocepacia]MBY4740321.1 TrbG/VirB9 family P-type conjugative transfer protein [Burkholderia cepacia]VBB17459.1 putative plasmid conjugation protein TrbG [Burkholderia stabilis]HDR9767740.1 TrbG/VirB9 family P-type conjugative transfer protein [Burkholderia cepacia ATCC 25416]MBA9834245.1 conjugal transfer protein TrbG [Burkholder